MAALARAVELVSVLVEDLEREVESVVVLGVASGKVVELVSALGRVAE